MLSVSSVVEAFQAEDIWQSSQTEVRRIDSLSRNMRAKRTIPAEPEFGGWSHQEHTAVPVSWELIHNRRYPKEMQLRSSEAIKAPK